MFQLAGVFFPPLSSQTPTTQLLSAYSLVRSVRLEMQALLPQALAADGVTVSQLQVQRWLASLQSAYDILNRLPVTLIYPPPQWVGYAQQAAAQIQQAIALLGSIPVAAPFIYPPVEGQVTILLQNLEQLISWLQSAEYNLLLAAQSA